LEWYTLHVSDGLSVQHHEFRTVHTASGICHVGSGGCLLAVCTVLNSWCWTDRPPGTSRVYFSKKKKRNRASGWFYYRNISRCTVPCTSIFFYVKALGTCSNRCGLKGYECCVWVSINGKFTQHVLTIRFVLSLIRA